MKCMPTTRCGLLVTAASRVMEMEDVLDAMMVWTLVTCVTNNRDVRANNPFCNNVDKSIGCWTLICYAPAHQQPDCLKSSLMLSVSLTAQSTS